MNMYRVRSTLSRVIARPAAFPAPVLSSPVQRCNFSGSGVKRDGQFKDVRKMFDIQGRNYIVTGGGQGIGFAITQAICQMGGNVAVLDLRDEPVEAYNSLASEFGVKTGYHQADVTKEASLTTSFQDAVSELGSIDGLVTAAGIVVDKPFLDQSWDEVDRLQKVNFMGTFFAAQLATRQFLRQDTPGSVVTIASICAHQVAPGHKLSGYHATKGAVLMMTRALGVEFAPSNIRFNSISPGYTDSVMTQKLRSQYPELVAIMDQAPPMKRIGSTNDLVGGVLYFLSDAAAYTTSADICVTGGLHAGRMEVNSIK